MAVQGGAIVHIDSFIYPLSYTQLWLIRGVEWLQKLAHGCMAI